MKMRHMWSRHVKRKSTDAPIRRCEKINILDGMKGNGKPNKNGDKIMFRTNVHVPLGILWGMFASLEVGSRPFRLRDAIA